MSQVTEQSVRLQTALASIKLIHASAVLDLTEDDFDFLTSNKVWIATDRSRARRCVFFFSSRRLHTICYRDWSSDVCSSDLGSRRLESERSPPDRPYRREIPLCARRRTQPMRSRRPRAPGSDSPGPRGSAPQASPRPYARSEERRRGKSDDTTGRR